MRASSLRTWARMYVVSCFRRIQYVLSVYSACRGERGENTSIVCVLCVYSKSEYLGILEATAKGNVIQCEVCIMIVLLT